ncbi:glutaredoxin family protein [Nitrosomonas aestuarii]|uniref:glutaredoxin family protein n=1 Tax=Nitrosomonas aestuarii TaxID=52441 RepID=UPI000D303105|nr:glutaredoxin family protein [Nitrosomonas aestuarii]PTN12645.1 glutaredoxin-like protein DUF836 [Nitrosomonas aestuarii]
MTKSDEVCALVVFGREECHLCNQMIVDLQKRQEQITFDFQVIDIDTDPDLRVRFNDKVPVLMSLSDQKEICHYYLDLAALDDYLAKIR